MTRRWRPSLAFVLGGALAGTLALSFAGLVALRYLGPEIGFRNAAVLLAGGIVVLTSALGWLLVRLLLRPIVALERYAVEQPKGGAAAPKHFGTRELHRTARAVIEMAETLRDREATIRSFTDHVTHELKTPVSTIRAASELLQDAPDLSADDLLLINQIDQARLQIEAQLQALRDAARAKEMRYLGQARVADLNLAKTHPALEISLQGEAPLPMAENGLRLVLDQLLQNATQQGARQVHLTTLPQGDQTTLVVKDDGPGISSGNVPHLFTPFFTTRRASGGTGMGLFILRTILAAHHARIEFSGNHPGAMFTLIFTKPLPPNPEKSAKTDRVPHQ